MDRNIVAGWSGHPRNAIKQEQVAHQIPSAIEVDTPHAPLEYMVRRWKSGKYSPTDNGKPHLFSKALPARAIASLCEQLVTCRRAEFQKFCKILDLEAEKGELRAKA